MVDRRLSQAAGHGSIMSAAAEQGRHTKVLDILVREQAQGAGAAPRARLGAGALRLVDDDTIGKGSGDKRRAVAELGHAAIVVEADPREAVADGGEDEGEVAGQC